MLGIRRYVQSHRRDPDSDAAMARPRGAPEPFDGVAELWWDSAEALAASVRTEEGKLAARVLIEDERRFIDFARSPIWTAEEHEVITDERFS